ncbi:MAG TPA: hypothetical protein VGP93_09185, partial [Polyangiaceae bacterium]|nr:hypothetical protein [Polyangiaceae bacterium]
MSEFDAYGPSTCARIVGVSVHVAFTFTSTSTNRVWIIPLSRTPLSVQPQLSTMQLPMHVACAPASHD